MWKGLKGKSPLPLPPPPTPPTIHSRGSALLWYPMHFRQKKPIVITNPLREPPGAEQSHFFVGSRMLMTTILAQSQKSTSGPLFHIL